MRVLANVRPTPEQLAIVSRNRPGIEVIRGAAGSGKTTTALLRLRSRGNHRGSVFRLLVGAAMAARNQQLSTPTWGKGQSAPKNIREKEADPEREVSRYIGRMPFLWVEADDTPSSESVRAYIERNAIALLSNNGHLKSDRSLFSCVVAPVLPQRKSSGIRAVELPLCHGKIRSRISEPTASRGTEMISGCSRKR